ncbi:hypothetical protein COO91_02400 [Nostoc flagelliforme CCNUN1]|uniref:Uncharacterized protein n=1 Tax=Nostoc flagelliforme CCNUN1 TaxID=2038116 RepID=A0A2K8SM49_9NOSO|nr:hypothetical protein [Nostoc flagelliforme]AUB36488.1 hypothetical protein COO91_02400 [Nostoc flagelliforme CCNUN1]
MFNFSTYSTNWLLRNYQESPKRPKSLKETVEELNKNQIKMADTITKLNTAIDKQTKVTEKLLEWLQNAPNKP